MARDRGGFEQGRRKCPKTGKPLKLMSQPSNAAYRDGWERTFGKKQQSRIDLEKKLAEVEKAARNSAYRFTR